MLRKVLSFYYSLFGRIGAKIFIMKPNNGDGDLTLAQKVKAVGTMTLVTGVLLASAVGYTSYQRNAKAEAAALLQKQIAAAMAKKAILPLYRETKEFKDLQGEKMVKVRIEDLPTTITAGLDETVSPNPLCQAGVRSGYWLIGKVGGSSSADDGAPNGWSVADGGVIGIPADAEYGKYQVTYNSYDTCTTEGGTPNDGVQTYSYVFKITPPCPTGVTLTQSP